MSVVKQQRDLEIQQALERLTDAVLESLEEKKAQDVLVIDVRGHCDFADRFVIATGRSNRQLSAMARSLIEVAHRFDLAGRIEGLEAMEWLLVDMGDLVIHLFLPDVRQEFQLEKLWGHPGADASA